MLKWTRKNGVNVATTDVEYERYEVMPRLNAAGKAKKGAGYDIYHRTATRRIWIGFASTVDAAKALVTDRHEGAGFGVTA